MSTVYLEAAETLGPYPATLTNRLQHWAARAGNRVFLADRDANGNWQTVTYAEFHNSVRNVAQALLNRNLSPRFPVVVLSGNSIPHAILGMAAMYIGLPYAPVSPAYSPRANGAGDLTRIFQYFKPQLLFAPDGVPLQVPHSTELIAADRFSDLLQTPATSDVDNAGALVSADTVAKILFTSGSTGQPKGVINTQRMLTSNQQMIVGALPSLSAAPPVLCDWLSWHHTFGGNHNFGLVLYNGGTLYIDRGKPFAGAVETTLRNLREVSPTACFNVPKGYDLLAESLELDAKLSHNFFRRLQFMFCAGAGLSPQTWHAMQHLALRASGRKIPMLSGFGSTETAPMALFAGAEIARPGVIGVPVAGVRVKLVPANHRFELRVRGPNVTPGFWHAEQLAAPVFDDEGFYQTGDAVRWADPAVPSRGLLFAGRLSPNFKISNGTWVDVESLRMKIVAHCAPYVQDVIFAGRDRDQVTALIALHPNTPATQESLRRALQSLASQERGASRKIARAAILPDSLRQDCGEITAKGSLNCPAVLKNYNSLVEDLYTKPPPPHILVFS